MGNCLFGSPTDDFTRLNSEEQHEIDRQISNSIPNEAPPAYERESREEARNRRREQRRARNVGTYHTQPGIQRPADQLTEEEQIRIAQRIGLIQHLPTGLYYEDNTAKKGRECAICMIEFEIGEQLRFLPCLHAYHKACIDDWLMRSFTCPSCMEPVDAALLRTFE